MMPHISRKPLTRQTVHGAMFQWLKHGDVSSVKRNLENHHTRFDVDVLFEPSANGYNLLHDLIRLGNPDHSIDYHSENYKYIRSLVFNALKENGQEKHEFKHLLLGRAENNISVLASAVDIGDVLLVKEIYDLAFFCTPKEIVNELRLTQDTRRTNLSLTLFDNASYHNKAPQGQKAFKPSNYVIMCFLTSRLRELEPENADYFIFNALNHTSFFTERPNPNLPMKEKVNELLKNYLSRVTP